jgi:hypothetical protein
MAQSPVPSELPPGGGRGFWLYSTKPTRFTLFLRTFVPWQMFRFLYINAKMVAIILRGHRGQPHA